MSGHKKWAEIRREIKRTDPTLLRAAWSEDQVDAYLEAEKRLCQCEALDTCGWNDPDSLAMIQIERMGKVE